MNNEQLLDETRRLKEAIKGVDERLAKNLHLSKETARLSEANRNLTHWALGLAALCLVSIAGTGYVVLENRENDKVQCMNANESRKAQIAVWDYVLGYELADGSEAQAPAETEMSKTILPYMHKIWAQRDCDNLDKQYILPDPPTPPPPVN